MVKNATGEVQNVLVLGGRSEIGLAIARRMITPATRHVVLACRRPDEAEAALSSLARPGLEVRAVSFDAAATASHRRFIDGLVDDIGDVDVAIVAFGVLGDQEAIDDDPDLAVPVAHVNYTGAVSATLHVARRMRAARHGRIVVLSSVAGERVRKANYVYGSTKAGLDGFAQGLADAVMSDGVAVTIVRPGFVHSRMTAGMKAAPFSTTPDAVAECTVAAVRRGRRIVWAPGVLRWVFMVLRHLPSPLWRRLPLG